VSKPRPPTPQLQTWWSPPEVHPPIRQKNSVLFNRLPLQACVELTPQPLTSISFFPTRRARLRAVLKTVILFVAEYVSTTWEDGAG